ncbi:tetratricopeptide repeat protein [Vibrio sp. Of14-4]|uniref:Tetratricopeptide repeat protein n=1 Tax=Vibrio tetraodonis subsp. pristinus TaxID=2695891 RepID=A0A6L8M3U6_9VIBR|nr:MULTISPECIES: tetratricopeptide repeat protein [Vibrio]MCG7489163.1 tetratricopeptide repeat protein [Vibrio sp. Of14-4]MYM60639.1 tetratricopeptide repeat protein [Vibrio tetraodonis subsp. pristinus]
MLNLNLFSTEELLALSAQDLEKNELATGLEKLKFLLDQGVVSDELDSMLGSVYAKLQLFTEAAERYSALLDRDPSRLHERFQLGMVYRELGETSKALENWDQVLSTDSNYPPVLFHKALVLLAENETKDAEDLLMQLTSTAEADNYYAERAVELINELGAIEPNPEGAELDSVH